MDRDRLPRLYFPPTEHAENYCARALEFARDAAGDRRGRRHGEFMRLAAARFLEDARAAKDPACPWDFVPWHGNDVCDFVEKLPHVQGSWATSTITLEPVQCFILCTVFGFRRRRDKGRRFSMVYCEAARKFAKSTLSACVALYCLTCEGELGPQIVIGATTGDQAGKVFDPAKAMVDHTSTLRHWFNLETFVRSIVCHTNAGSIQPINAKASTQDGWNPHLGILDELHAHKTRALFDVIRSASGARANPLLWIITTAGYDTGGVCFEQRTLCTKVLRGVVEAPHIAAFIFTIDERDDPYDERCWIKANPMIGITPTLEAMREYSIDAQSAPGTAYEFKTKRLNIWTTAKDAHYNIELWKPCAGSLPLDALEAWSCWGGIDLAATSDLAAFCLVWRAPTPDDLVGASARYYVRCKFYLPADTILEHVRRRQVNYQQWVEQGWITATPGAAIDHDFIEADVLAMQRAHKLEVIGYDPWNATALTTRLMAGGANMIEMRQGAKTFNEPMKLLDRLMRVGRITHDGNPVLQWNLSNLVARRDANENLAPDRRNSQEKIDGAVALLMALAATELEGAPVFQATAAIG